MTCAYAWNSRYALGNGRVHGSKADMKRRTFLTSAAVAVAGGGAAWWARDWLPDRGLLNPCLAADLPEHLSTHPVVLNALDGLDRAKVWDCHIHLVGTGRTGPEKVWVNPSLDSL